MSPSRLETVEVEPGAADAVVVLMHGLGADGHDFESLVPELRLPPSPSVRWVFPHAPVRPVTINGGSPETTTPPTVLTRFTAPQAAFGMLPWAGQLVLR